MKGVVSMAAAMLAVSSVANAEPGSWITKELASPEGGQKYFVAQVASDEQLVNVDDRRQKATLSVRCDQKGLFVTFLWPEYVTGDTYDGNRVDIAWKIDAGAARQTRMRRVDQAAIALGKDGFKLLKEVSKGKTLTVRMPDMHGGQTATFPIDGISVVYDRVTAEGCG